MMFSELIDLTKRGLAAKAERYELVGVSPETSAKRVPEIVAWPLSPAWYAARSTGIGASEIAAAAGLSRYATPLEIYARKRGLMPEIEDNDAMRLGRKLEPVVKSEFCERTGLTLDQL